MPQEVQGQTAVDDTKLATVTSATTNKNKPDKKQTKTDEISKSLKRTAPTDITGQGDAKRKATNITKKPIENSDDSSTLKGSNPNTIAASAAAFLSGVPSTVAQNVAVDLAQVAPKHLTTETIPVSTPLTIDSLNSQIAVAPSTSSEQSTASEHSPPNMEELLNNNPQTLAQVQLQSQDVVNSGGKRTTTSRNLSSDERRQRRLLRNRVAAKECRRKKKAYVADLEEKVTRLEEENIRLHKEVEELNSKLAISAARMDENVRLRKEIEELNAKFALRSGNNEVKKESKSPKSLNKGEPNKFESNELKPALKS
ncbi:Skn-1-like basic-leucine zipper transcription factor [Gigaspora margarita]|uniref:Skn-1-like basic-leucine zipper transcription factor n=1 Tax=Gigaspora margarita TaxID=4874 RepID=A0A8H3X9B2_GIGMA|nr:Skn-1-like basic-leucine zipper transcription factor [Gigaspora margarita]